MQPGRGNGIALLAWLFVVGGGEGRGREWAEYTSNKAASVCCDHCDTELKLHVLDDAVTRWRLSGPFGRRHAIVIAAVHCSSTACWLYTSCCCEFCVRRALIYDIMRYLSAAIIAGLPHPQSISRYRLIDKNPTEILALVLLTQVLTTSLVIALKDKLELKPNHPLSISQDLSGDLTTCIMSNLVSNWSYV